ncbi:hypothetical protein, partial [Pectobacterium sp. CHL-2024]|uniref:hypothetical protein n=1 Tax=Pectobacterium sp. CHL-2024 TaxID=3377079 RepID=UPI00382624AF
RSADGSVGLPHVRVGNCQASNKTKASVERQGLFAMGNLGCYLQRFAHRCGSIAVYPTDNLTAKIYGGRKSTSY